MAQIAFSNIFTKFVQNPTLQGTFAHKFYQSFQYVQGHKLETSPKILILRMEIQKEFINVNGSIHGGALSTILDAATTLAILKVDPKHQVTVSVDMGLSFLVPAKLNDTLLIKAECQKLGKTLAFSTADIYIEDKLKLVASGRHVKAILNRSFFD